MTEHDNPLAAHADDIPDTIKRLRPFGQHKAGKGYSKGKGYKKGKVKLGKGAFGKVYEVTHSSGTKYAAKFIPKLAGLFGYFGKDPAKLKEVR